MKNFAIYEQSENDRAAVKVGFCWPGLLCSMLWLLFARLWERAGIVAGCMVALYIIAAFFASDAMGRQHEVAAFIIAAGPVIIALIIGGKGNRWRRINLRARGFGLVAVVQAGSKDEALAELREMSPERLSTAQKKAADHLREAEREYRGYWY